MANGSRQSTSGTALVREGGDGLEVLLTRRPDDRAFLGGFHGFFVGERERGDEAVPLRGGGGFVAPDRPAWGCAVRELFEEAGLLPLADGFVVSWADEPEVECPWGSWSSFRDRVDRDEIEFGEALRDAGLVVDVEGLHPVGEWSTPDWSELDARTEFFVYAPTALPPGILEHLDDAEHRGATWIEPAEAVRRWREESWFLSTPIRFILEALAEAARIEDGDLLPSPAERTRPMQELIELLGGVRVLPLATPTLPPATHTNCYIVGEGPSILVDPGSELSRETRLLEETLQILARRGNRPRAVVLTHHHRDHVDGVAAVRADWDVEIWAHAETSRRLAEIEVDRHLEDGEILTISPRHRMRVLHTPGHAPGHVALLHRRTGALLAGDLVASKGTILIDPPDGEMGAYMESLRRVDALDLEAILPAHGTVVSRPHELLRYYLEHRRDRERQVLEALRAAREPVRPGDLVPEVYDDAPRSAWPLAARSLLAHLIHLVERGEAERDGDLFRGADR